MVRINGKQTQFIRVIIIARVPALNSIGDETNFEEKKKKPLNGAEEEEKVVVLLLLSFIETDKVFLGIVARVLQLYT